MKILIIGFGSIGKKHFAAARELGLEVSLVSSQELPEFNSFKNLSEIQDLNAFGLVIVANPTSCHAQSLKTLSDLNYKNTILVEKPVISSLTQKNWDGLKGPCFVAYNLRFLKGLAETKKMISSQKVLSAQCYVGSYLPDWRPGTDYRLSYSASREQGGGVLRDLSHELDYIQWLCGSVNRVCATGGKFSHLELSCRDVVSAILELKSGTRVNLELNFVDRIGQRWINLNTNEQTFKLDLKDHSLNINGSLEKYKGSISGTYKEQIQALINGDTENLCSLESGIETVRLIEALEKSIEVNGWVDL